MKRKWKIVLVVALLLLVCGGVLASIRLNERGIVDVQAGKVVRQDLVSNVTASGEVKPRNYINLGANTLGPAPITAILVKEGDHVRKGQVVARLENTQAGADVSAQKAAINSSLADSAAAEAGLTAMDDSIQTAQAGLEKARAELERTKLNWDREQELYKEKLVARNELDQRKAEYDTALAGINEAQTRIDQAKAQRAQSNQQVSSAQRRVIQMQAGLTRLDSVLDKYSVVSPINGIVTNLPVRVGETVVPGIQNSSASTIMTVADMSLITAEVKVDETDIVNVQIGQTGEVTIDAMPNKTFTGHVIEIGNTAILRSTGVAASQSATSSQEAKDFKVVIALDNPPDDIRPGLSCTAKIVTATRKNALTIPIQALTMRERGDLVAQNGAKGAKTPAATTPQEDKANREELQGVFVIKNGRADFQKVDTGVTGATDIEVTRGLSDGEQIVIGSYKTIHNLRNDARVKVEAKPAVKTDT